MSARVLAALCTLSLLGAGPTAVPAMVPPLQNKAASSDILGACGDRDGWSDPAPPAHIHGRSWYVGTCGITAVLIETSAGLVLIDSGPGDAAAHVLANVRALGFDPRQVKWLLMTHEHFDHVGGMAAIQQATGARLVVLPQAAQAMRTGKPVPSDPQHGFLAKQPMAPVPLLRVMHDGAALTVGDTRFSLRATPTHSPGSASWTWKSCESGQCLTIAYADSISTISDDAYRFTAHPERIEQARAGLRTIEHLPCDILLTPHPKGSDLLQRLSGKQPLAQPRGCIAYAQGGSEWLTARLGREEAK